MALVDVQVIEWVWCTRRHCPASLSEQRRRGRRVSHGRVGAMHCIRLSSDGTMVHAADLPHELRSSPIDTFVTLLNEGGAFFSDELVARLGR